MTRRRYTTEFKKEAARMILIDGTPVREVSEQLGVPEGVLYSWKAKHLDELEASKPDGAPSPKALAAENAELRKELAKARRMNEILKKNGGLLQQPRLMQYQFIKANSDLFSIEELCDCFGLSRSRYYVWQSREPSARTREGAALKDRIDARHKQSKRRYGYQPIYHHLQDEYLDCGRDRTLRLINELGIAGTRKKGFKPLCMDSNHDFGYSPNLLREMGQPDGVDQAWVADTTFLRTEEGWSYLATVMDLCSRRVIGWSVSSYNDSQLVCCALRSAVLTRAGNLPSRLIHHSDRGSTYASYDYQDILQNLGILQSMSAKGNCYDNTAMESFFGRYKTSSVGDIVFATQDQARSNAFEYIEAFYNRFRKHASLGYKTPVQFEENFCPHGGKHPSLPTCINHN